MSKFLAIIIKIALIGILGIILLFGGVLFSFTLLENPISDFADYAALERSGLIERGWVPEYIPRSAFMIEEIHNLDTSSVFMKFRFAPGDTELAEKSCVSKIEKNGEIEFFCKDGKLILSDDGYGYFTN